MKRGIYKTRRRFLSDVGRGMLVASVGSAVASDLGLAEAAVDVEDGRLTFGKLEPLVALMQETPVDQLQPKLVEQHLVSPGVRSRRTSSSSEIEDG